MSRVIIAGASGCVGQAAIAEFAAQGYQVIALSRRKPIVKNSALVSHISVDLNDANQVAAVVSKFTHIDNLVYCASAEKHDLLQGWVDQDLINKNAQMLENLLEPLLAIGSLKHICLLQGTKAYGAHLHRIPIPAKEDMPRDPNPSFYWLQEDYTKTMLANKDIGFTIFRPQVIFGDVIGVAMNLVPVIAAYAAICKKLNMGFAFPGGFEYPLEAVDAGVLAKAIYWSGTSPKARNQTFNITNGDVFSWHSIWPYIADLLNIQLAEPKKEIMSKWLLQHAKLWFEVAAANNLVCNDIQQLVGKSDVYADFCFGTFAKRPIDPVLVSTIKLRQAGFNNCMDSVDMFAKNFASLRQQNLIP